MRHFRSILYALVLAPVVWVLAGVGLTGDLATRGRDDFAVETYTGLLLLLLAGTAYGILVFAPISPAGPVLAGLVYLGVTLWALNSPTGYAEVWPPGVSKESFDLSRPGYGVAALLAVPLLVTALSVRRWQRYEPVVLPIIGQLGRARGAAAVAGTPVSGLETTVLARPDSTDSESTTVLRLPATGAAAEDESERTTVLKLPGNDSERTTVLRGSSDDLPTSVVGAPDPDMTLVVVPGRPQPSEEITEPLARAEEEITEPQPVAEADQPQVAMSAEADQPSAAVSAEADQPSAAVADEETTEPQPVVEEPDTASQVVAAETERASADEVVAGEPPTEPLVVAVDEGATERLAVVAEDPEAVAGDESAESDKSVEEPENAVVAIESIPDSIEGSRDGSAAAEKVETVTEAEPLEPLADEAGSAETAKDSALETHSAAEAEPVLETEPVTDAEPSAEAERSAEAEPTTEAEPADTAEPTADTGFGAEAEPSAEAEPTTEPEPTAETEPTAEAEPADAAEPTADTGFGAEAEPSAETGAPAEAENAGTDQSDSEETTALTAVVPAEATADETTEAIATETASEAIAVDEPADAVATEATTDVFAEDEPADSTAIDATSDAAGTEEPADGIAAESSEDDGSGAGGAFAVPNEDLDRTRNLSVDLDRTRNLTIAAEDVEQTRNLTFAEDIEKTQNIALAAELDRTQSIPLVAHPETVRNFSDDDRTRDLALGDLDKTGAISLPVVPGPDGADLDRTRDFSVPIPDPDRTQVVSGGKLADDADRTQNLSNFDDPDRTQTLTFAAPDPNAIAPVWFPPPTADEVAAVIPVSGPGEGTRRIKFGAKAAEPDATQVIPPAERDPESTQLVRGGTVEPPGDRTEILRLPIPDPTRDAPKAAVDEDEGVQIPEQRRPPAN